MLSLRLRLSFLFKFCASLWCAELSEECVGFITENIKKRQMRANVIFTSRTKIHLLWKNRVNTVHVMCARWAHCVMCRIISLRSALFSVCFQNVKTNKCIMFIQPLVRCVQNTYTKTMTRDADNEITPTHHTNTQWRPNSDTKSNVEHFVFGSLVVSFGLVQFGFVLEYCLYRLLHFC